MVKKWNPDKNDWITEVIKGGRVVNQRFDTSRTSDVDQEGRTWKPVGSNPGAFSSGGGEMAYHRGHPIMMDPSDAGYKEAWDSHDTQAKEFGATQRQRLGDTNRLTISNNEIGSRERIASADNTAAMERLDKRVGADLDIAQMGETGLNKRHSSQIVTDIGLEKMRQTGEGSRLAQRLWDSNLNRESSERITSIKEAGADRRTAANNEASRMDTLMRVGATLQEAYMNNISDAQIARLGLAQGKADLAMKFKQEYFLALTNPQVDAAGNVVQPGMKPDDAARKVNEVMERLTNPGNFYQPSIEPPPGIRPDPPTPNIPSAFRAGASHQTPRPNRFGPATSTLR